MLREENSASMSLTQRLWNIAFTIRTISKPYILKTTNQNHSQGCAQLRSYGNLIIIVVVKSEKWFLGY